MNMGQQPSAGCGFMGQQQRAQQQPPPPPPANDAFSFVQETLKKS